MDNQNNLALVDPDDLTLVQNNFLNKYQLSYILKPTPPQYIKQRTAKGGGEWSYASGGYIKKVLNLMFGWDWDFEVVKDIVLEGQIMVLGKLTARSGGRSVVKMQYGGKDIVYENDYFTDENGKKLKKKSNRPLDIGNDFKAACTDSLKKCAAELGICADIYNREEFRAVNVDLSEVEESKQQFEADYPNPQIPLTVSDAGERLSESIRQENNYISNIIL